MIPERCVNRLEHISIRQLKQIRATYCVSHLRLEECIGDVLLVLYVSTRELISIIMANEIPSKDGEGNVRLVDELWHR